MAQVQRRVILKPAGLTEEQSARLKELLGAAIERQRQLATKSMHVLEFTGNLEQNEQAFFVEHEPAEPFPTAGLFDPEAEGADEKTLLRLSAAIFNALGNAHSGGGRPYAHGGLCPGAILETPDKIIKISDFGIAPAVCNALGVDSYKNLAAGPRLDGPPETLGTGVWEILGLDVEAREDRICSFIDPQKYGTQVLDTFESGSDVIAAGFILHLMAEHQHPYLYSVDPAAHLLPDMSEFMAEMRYNGARRPDLRESTDPAVRLWCDLVAKALGRLPENRPSSTEIGQALSEHVKPVDAGEILRDRLKSIEEQAKEGNWVQVRSQAKGIADNDEAPADVAERANALLRLAAAWLLLDQATDLLKGDEWPTAQQPLDNLLALPALPAEVSEQAKKADGVLKHNLGVLRELEALQPRLDADDGTNPAETDALCQDLVTELERLPPAKSLLPVLRKRLKQMRDDVAERREAATAQLQEAIEADRAEAEKWLGDLEKALADEQWDVVDQQLGAKPQLTHWPDTAAQRAAEIKKLLESFRAEQQLKAAIKADRKTAEAWIGPLRQAVEVEDWDQAGKSLAAKPELTHWPEGLQDEARALGKQVQAAVKRRAELKQAHEWHAQLAQAVEAKNWSAGVTVLANRPTLENWPEEVLEKEGPLRSAIESAVEQAELAERLAREWLAHVEELGQQEQWQQALDALDQPPEVEEFPAEAAAKADALKKEYAERLAEAIRKQREAQIRAVQELAEGFVKDLAARKLEGLVDPGAVRTTIDVDQVAAAESLTEGISELTAELGPADAGEEKAAAATFEFQLEPAPPRIRDDDGQLAETVTTQLTTRLFGLQKSRAGELFAPLRNGLFPKAKVRLRLEQPARSVPVSVDLLGGGQKEETLETEINWDPAGLAWAYADAGAFAVQAGKIVAKATRQALAPRLTEKSDILKQYQASLGVELKAPSKLAPEALAAALPLEGRLSIKPGAEAEPTVLQAFTVKCAAIGNARLEGDLSEAEAKLRQMVVAAQSSACEAIASDLRSKAESAAAKVRVTTQPKRITDPVDEVGFDLKSKKRQPVTLTARWSAKAFTYQPANGWEEALGEFLAAPAPGAAAPSGPGRNIAIAVVVVAVLAGGWSLWPTGSTENIGEIPERNGDDQPNNQTTQGQDGTGETDPAPGPGRTGTADGEGGPVEIPRPDTPPPSPFEEPLGVVRAILVNDGPYRAVDAQSLVRAPSDPAESAIHYRLAGLAYTWEPVALTRSDDGQSWDLAAGEEDAIRQALSQLADVLDDDPTTSLTGAAQNALGDDQFTSLIDSGAVQPRITLAAAPQWAVAPPGDHLVASGTQASVVLEAQTGTGLLQVDGIPADLQVRDGTLSVVAPTAFEQELITRLGAALLDAQRQSLANRRTELATPLGDAGASLVADPADLAEPAASVRFSIQPAGLTARTFEATWDTQTLSFVFDTGGAAASPGDQVGDVVLAHRTLEAINGRSSPGDDWLGRGSVGPVFEMAAPDDQGIWSLAVAAPWVSPQTAPADVPSEGRLVIELAWPTDNPAAEDLAAGILADEAQPEYWPLTEAFRRVQDQPDPQFLQQAVANADAGADREANRVLEYLKTDPQYVAPEVDLVDGGRPRLVATSGGAVPDTLEVTFQGRWGVQNLPAGIAGDRLLTAIQEGAPPVELTVPFVVSSGQVQVGDTDAALAAFAPTLTKAQSLEVELYGFAERRPVEETIKLVLNGKDRSGPNTNVTDLYTVLDGIWKMKGSPGAHGVNPIGLSRGLRSGNEALVFQKVRARGGGVARDSILATALVEFFCGPEWTYAVAWGVKRDPQPSDSQAVAFDPEPVLLRLCATSTLQSAVDAGAADGQLGQTMLQPVLEALSNPLAVTDEGYGNQIGLILALDGPLFLLGENFTQIGFAEQSCFLTKLGDELSFPGKVRWSKLADLRNSDRSCDFHICRALTAVTIAPPTGDELWALQQILAAANPSP